MFYILDVLKLILLFSFTLRGKMITHAFFEEELVQIPYSTRKLEW